ncbi:MAG TPA: PAS domain S-box protein, partial [Gallionella sp.]|nr:PAS domain S-box protein [Gallionella sp.]
MSSLSGLTSSRLLITAIALLYWWALCWFGSEAYFSHQAETAYRQESQRAEQFVASAIQGFDRIVAVRAGMPRVLARMPDLNRMLNRFGPDAAASPLAYEERQQRWTADPALAGMSSQFKASAADLGLDTLALLNAAGDCVAASNADMDNSPVGTNYADRKYFADIRAGRSGYQLGVGKKSRTAGIVFYAPVIERGRVLGAVVSRVKLAPYANWFAQTDAFLTDHNGVVMLARDASSTMRALPDAPVGKLDAATRQALYGRTDFPALRFTSWGDARFPELLRGEGQAVPVLLRSKSIAGGDALLTVAWPLPQLVKFDEERSLVAMTAGTGGTLLFLLLLAAFLQRGARHASLRSLQERAELEQRQSQFFRLAPGFFYTLVQRADGGYAMPFASAGIRDLFGLEPDDVAQNCAPLIARFYPEDSERMFGKIDESESGMLPFHFECRIHHPTKGLRWVEAHSLRQRTPDGGVRRDGFMHDITERKRMDDALYFVAQRGWLGSAKNFFDALALYLGETLGVDHVVIDRLDQEPGIVETVAVYAKGDIVRNLRYSLHGTPCENVMGREFCFYPQGIQQMFPEDTLLVDMGAESYAGIPLWDSVGKPIGLIAVLDSKPHPDPTPISQLLQFVATRAAAELERERSERILRERERSFRSLAENAPDNIVRFDRAGRIIYANPVLERLLGVPSAELLGKAPSEAFPAGFFDDLESRIRQVV